LQIHRYTLSKGVLLRPLGNVIYFMPPYVITPEELTLMFDVAWEAMIHFTTH
jgi:adenosylmethionine-8-amino-7-oxononanoate aminotransferase